MEKMFDLLRAKVEAEISHPAVVAITSATDEDGREVAAQALAASLAATGYSTLLVDTCSGTNGGLRPVEGVPFDEISRREINTQMTSRLEVISIGQSVQRTTNHRHTKAAFTTLREKFDYVIISTGFCGTSNPFAANVVSASNAVLVAVKVGRRQTRDDARLAADLNRLGPRFLGLIPMMQLTMDTADATDSLKAADAKRSVLMPTIENTIEHRELGESPRQANSRVANAIFASLRSNCWPRFLGRISMTQSTAGTVAATQSLMPADAAALRSAPMSLPIAKTTGRRETAAWPGYAVFGGSASVALLAWLLVEVSSR